MINYRASEQTNKIWALGLSWEMVGQTLEGYFVVYCGKF